MTEKTSQIPALLPKDPHNQKLESNTHPPDWVNPAPQDRYNVVVIGGGTAGLVTAAACAGLGGRAALIERSLLGGDCLNVGCVPSKALIRAARAFAEVRDAGRFGVRVPEGVEVDFGAVMERMRKLRADISPHDSAERFKGLGVDVFLGSGEFVSSDTIKVGDTELKFKKAVIATGARAIPLPIPGLKEAGFLTNETVFSLTELPKRLAVIGAGPIGCELAQAFARFGSKVSLIEVAPQILIREDRDAAERVAKSMERDGVDMVLSAKLKEITTRDGARILNMEDGTAIEVDEILVGVGRAPNTEGLGLDKVGVEFDRTGVKVDDYLRTTNSRIYAAGDICFPYKFTHTADAMARIVIRNALFPGRGWKTSALIIPWCTYTDPEIAHVGMYEKDAKEKGYEVETFTQDFEHMDRAILDGETDGFAKIHVQKGTDKILGATVVAKHAGEMISEITVAMYGGLGMKKLAGAIHPYPTQAECWKRLGDAFMRTTFTGWKKGFVNWLLK